MVVHHPTHPSSELSKEENESEPNLEWAPCEVSAGVQHDLNVLTNKIHSSPGETEYVTLTMPPCAPEYQMHKMADGARTMNNGRKHHNILLEPAEKRKLTASDPHRR
jgi:hypothetical protein